LENLFVLFKETETIEKEEAGSVSHLLCGVIGYTIWGCSVITTSLGELLSDEK